MRPHYELRAVRSSYADSIRFMRGEIELCALIPGYAR